MLNVAGTSLRLGGGARSPLIRGDSSLQKASGDGGGVDGEERPPPRGDCVHSFISSPIHLAN